MNFRIFRTLVYLRPIQVWYYFVRRVLKLPRLESKSPVLNIRETFSLGAGISLSKELIQGESFYFLNVEERHGDSVNWHPVTKSKLWAYNLHYFDYLKQSNVGVEDKGELINSWIASQADISDIGWEPYPTSLRLINWIFFFSKQNQIDKKWLESLARQSAWLERNIEHHIQANHILENAKALMFAGSFFSGCFGERLFKQGVELFMSEVRQQFLSDGLHYERSPMYHAVVLTGLLDACNLMINNGSLFESDHIDFVVATTKSALDAITQITPVDDDVPFFNDSTHGIAPTCSELVRYGGRLFDYSPPNLENQLVIHSFWDAGYHVIRNGDGVLIIDCGDIGPPYQPGHTHCDMLSFEYWLAGKKVFTNCGNYDYELSEERTYARSTAAHNTVEIDGEEQSEIWGAFRVGRRAQILKNEIEKNDSQITFVGKHDGYRVLYGKILHQRMITIRKDGGISIFDELIGKGKHTAKSFLHLVSGYSVSKSGAGFEVRDPDDSIVCVVHPDDDVDVEIIETPRFPEFGLKELAKTVVFQRTDKAPFEVGYRITKRQV